MKKRNMHDEYVDQLLDKLSTWGFDHLDKNVPYDGGECDVFGMMDGCLYYFEVKSSKKHRNKAVEQLNRWARNHKNQRKHGFIYTGKDDDLELLF